MKELQKDEWNLEREVLKRQKNFDFYAVKNQIFIQRRSLKEEVLKDTVRSLGGYGLRNCFPMESF